MLPKAIYRLTAIPIISPAALVTELEQKTKAALGSWRSKGGQGSTGQRREGMDRKCQVSGAGHGWFRTERVGTEGDTPLGRSQGRNEVLLMESPSHTTRKPRTRGQEGASQSDRATGTAQSSILPHGLGDPTKATSPSQFQDLQLSDRKENQHLVGSRGNGPREKA